MANTSPRPMPVLGNVHPIKIRLPKRFPLKTFEINCQSSFWDTLLNCYMLNVSHVTNDVKWRPIVTTFSTLIENMSRTGLYDCHIFQIFFDKFMSNINCGIGVLHVDVFIVMSFLCSLKFLLFHLIGHTKRCLQKNIEHFLCLSFCDMTVPSKSKVPSLWPWPLTYESQCFFQWIDNDPISVLYEFQIDISNNSREIKYQNMGIDLLHVKRRTRQEWR